MRLRRTAILLGLALLAIAATLAPLMLRRDLRMTANARKVAKLSDIIPGGMDLYTWINSEELLCFREEGASVDGRRVNGIVVRNVKTGAERHLRKLEERFFRNVGHGISGYDVSPDGQWLLWKADDSVRASRLDGSDERRWRAPWNGSDDAVRWLADSNGWAAFSFHYPPNECVIVPLDSRLLPGPLRTPSLASGSKSETPTVLPAGAVMANDPNSQPGGLLSVFRVPLNSKSIEAPIEVSVKPPPGTTAGLPCFSYDGSRIAWVITRKRNSSLPGWLRRMLPFMRSDDGEVTSLWVSRSDGRDFREIGFLERSTNEEDLQNVRWLPDNRTISFEHAGSLQIIAAD